MKEGKAVIIADTYIDDAVDCGPDGNCFKGRLAIEQHMKEQFEKLGTAKTASVIRTAIPYLCCCRRGICRIGQAVASALFVYEAQFIYRTVGKVAGVVFWI